MPSENQLSLLTINGLEHTVSVLPNALKISWIWFPPLHLFRRFEGHCFREGILAWRALLRGFLLSVFKNFSDSPTEGSYMEGVDVR